MLICPIPEQISFRVVKLRIHIIEYALVLNNTDAVIIDYWYGGKQDPFFSYPRHIYALVASGNEGPAIATSIPGVTFENNWTTGLALLL